MSFYFEGYDARGRGESIWSCPYKIGTAGYDYWRRGWVDVIPPIAKSWRAAGLSH